MNIVALRADQLTQTHFEAWSRVQRASPLFHSPFFRPEFTQLVASLQDDVEVAVMEEHGEPIGFFPFHRDRRGVARPVGLGMCDYQAVIVDGEASWTASQLLRECRLRAWHFDHLLAAQTPLQPYYWRVAESPYADLSRGFAPYQEYISRRTTLKKVWQRIRKIEREVGPLSFVLNAQNGHVFGRLVDWKTAQCKRTGAVYCFREPWRIEMSQRAAAMHAESFGGLLSALYAGDQLIAVHLGLRSEGSLHGWVCAYNTEFHKYSPGLILWLRLAEAAEGVGITRIEFGKGDEHYKRVFSTGVVHVAEGTVDSRWLHAIVRRNCAAAGEALRKSRLRGPLQALVRGIRGRCRNCYVVPRWNTTDAPAASED